jgi:hypothetical protein
MVAKSANPTTYETVGTSITYSYHVTNIGTDPIDTIQVVDDRAGAVTCPSTLAGGASFDCQATYAITAQDILDMSVTNTVTVTSTNGVLSTWCKTQPRSTLPGAPPRSSEALFLL